MATAAQIQANRTNAQLSTGPRSETGKSAASQNSGKHHLTGGSALAPGEDASAYEAHLAAYRQQYAPESLPEEQLVTQLADAAWRLERVARMEREILEKCANPFLDPADPMAVQILRLTRYRTSIQRTLTRADKQLQCLVAEAAARRQERSEAARNTAYDQVRSEGVEPWTDAGRAEVNRRIPQLLAAAREYARTVLARQNEPNRKAA